MKNIKLTICIFILLILFASFGNAQTSTYVPIATDTHKIVLELDETIRFGLIQYTENVGETRNLAVVGGEAVSIAEKDGKTKIQRISISKAGTNIAGLYDIQIFVNNPQTEIEITIKPKIPTHSGQFIQISGEGNERLLKYLNVDGKSNLLVSIDGLNISSARIESFNTTIGGLREVRVAKTLKIRSQFVEILSIAGTTEESVLELHRERTEKPEAIKFWRIVNFKEVVIDDSSDVSKDTEIEIKSAQIKTLRIKAGRTTLIFSERAEIGNIVVDGYSVQEGYEIEKGEGSYLSFGQNRSGNLILSGKEVSVAGYTMTGIKHQNVFVGIDEQLLIRTFLKPTADGEIFNPSKAINRISSDYSPTSGPHDLEDRYVSQPELIEAERQIALNLFKALDENPGDPMLQYLAKVTLWDGDFELSKTPDGRKELREKLEKGPLGVDEITMRVIEKSLIDVRKIR